MTTGGIQVEGARELRRTMKRAGDDLQDLKDAHSSAAGLVAATAAMRAPRRTGRLRGSLRGSGTKTAAIIRAGAAAVPYANPIHWGWPARGIAANPFITEAAQSTEAQWVELYDKSVEKIVARIKGI